MKIDICLQNWRRYSLAGPVHLLTFWPTRRAPGCESWLRVTWPVSPHPIKLH